MAELERIPLQQGNGKRTRVFGMEIDVLDAEDALTRIVGASVRQRDPGGPIRVTTVNLYHAMLRRQQPSLSSALNESEIVVADGMPLIWASRWSTHPLPERVAGSDMILPLCREAAAHGASIFALGTTLRVLCRTCSRLSRRYPGLRIAGVYAPPFGFGADHPLNEEVIHMIDTCRPDILFVALGAPKQEIWMRTHRRHLQTKSVLGVGASLDYLAGAERRAPRPLQLVGLEWLWRMVLSPRHLGWRYTRLLGILPMLSFEQWLEYCRERGGWWGALMGMRRFLGSAEG